MLEYQIVEKAAFTVVGVKRRFASVQSAACCFFDYSAQ